MITKRKDVPIKNVHAEEKSIMKFNLRRLLIVAVISLCIVGLYTTKRTALADENNTNSGSGHDYWEGHDGSSDDDSRSHDDSSSDNWKKCKNCKKGKRCHWHKLKHVKRQKKTPGRTQKGNTNISGKGLFGDSIGVGVKKPQGELDVGERTDPVGGTCPIGYTHVDYNEDGFIDEGECWRGMVVKNGTVGIGTVSPTLTLDVNGQIRIRGGSPFAGAVLTSDSFGNASWMSVIIDDDSDPTNELQTLSLEGTNLTIENGNTVDLSSLQSGSTTDNQTLSLSGTNLTIVDGNTVDMGSLQDGSGTDDQNLTGAALTGTLLTIDIESGSGASVDLASLSGTNTDNQTLSLSGTDLTIVDGNTVDLASLSGTNTDNQSLTGSSLSGTLLSINIEGGSGTAVDLVSLQDGSGTDNQTLSLAGTDLTIVDGNTVDLASLSGTNTDNQSLTGSTLSGTLLSINIEGGSGTAVDLGSLQDGSGTDDQTLSLAGTNLTIVDGNTVDLSSLSGTVAGTNTQVIYNNAGNEAGAGIYFDNVNSRVGIGITDPTVTLDVDGIAKVDEIHITAGADLSERFDVSKNSDIKRYVDLEEMKIKPGMVVCIDPNNPGKLLVNTKAYDTRVAGIISGAGGIQTGMLMGQRGSVADGNYPIALTGRVYCYVDATDNPVRPGDLLTTSGTPGHAMKVTEYSKAQGAILGKAMTSLDIGKGLVLVLVTLQ